MSGLRDAEFSKCLLDGQGLAPGGTSQGVWCAFGTGEWCEVEVKSGRTPGIFFNASRCCPRDGPHKSVVWCGVELESDSEEGPRDEPDL